jgi:predicted ester cyclase
MSVEENQAVVRRYFDALDHHRLDELKSFIGPGYRLQFDGNPVMEADAALGLLGAFLGAFPDIRHEIRDQFGAGDRVATRIFVSGTQRDELMGIPATGNQIAITAVNIMRLEDGKFVEHWVNSDSLTMLRQLGVVPAS